MILGTPEQERALAKQLDCIFDAQPHAVLGGSLGRAAIYGQFGYDAVPLSLADPAHRVSRLRDIDLMFTDEHLFGMDDAGLARLGPHTIDTCLGAFIRRDQRGCGVLTAKDEDGRVTTFLLDPEVIRRVQRPFWAQKSGRSRLARSATWSAW